MRVSASLIVATMGLLACNRKQPQAHRDDVAPAAALDWYRVEIDAGEEGRIPFWSARC